MNMIQKKAFDVGRMFGIKPADTGHQQAEVMGTAGGIGLGGIAAGAAGARVLPHLMNADPKTKAMAILLSLLAAVGGTVGGGVGGYAAANKLRPEQQMP